SALTPMTRTSRARIFPLTRINEAAEGAGREYGRLKSHLPVETYSCSNQNTVGQLPIGSGLITMEFLSPQDKIWPSKPLSERATSNIEHRTSNAEH
ncbi:MAG: hypothetical protein ABI042_17790, partial [Verrucomicrobiota bacterium]